MHTHKHTYTRACTHTYTHTLYTYLRAYAILLPCFPVASHLLLLLMFHNSAVQNSLLVRRDLSETVLQTDLSFTTRYVSQTLDTTGEEGMLPYETTPHQCTGGLVRNQAGKALAMENDPTGVGMREYQLLRRQHRFFAMSPVRVRVQSQVFALLYVRLRTIDVTCK